jgi:branched-chain amino acid transport system ATP-binding protein
MPELLEVKGLNASYGATQVLYDMNFSLAQGQITAILGANGAGKTTTLRAICQTVKTSGSVLFDGQQLVGKPTESVVRMGVAHVPDGRGTFTALSVEENLKLGAYVRKDRAEVALDINAL